MAVVYLARDRKHERAVAVKVLRPELAAALGVERFLREIRIAAGLQHPNILPLYDSGEAGGLLYYVMPYVEGDSLRDRIRKGGPMALADALAIVAETADALGYAHSHNVVHRDIKPENILLSGGHALVADFGIARAISAAGGDRVTETGVSVGTPAYMSPEQALADPQVDGRADIYALGCVLYEMLAGEPPFTGPTAQAVIARHSLDPVPPLTTVRPGVPAELDAAMRRALAKVPADRYPTAADFRAALSGARPAAGPRASTGRRWVVAAAAATMLMSAALFLRRPAVAGPPSVAVLPFRNLSSDPDDEAFSDGMAEELTAALSKIDGVRVAAPNSAATFRNASASPQAIGKALGVGTLVEGSVLRAGGRWRVVTHLTSATNGYDLWSDVYERDAKDVFAVQDEIVRAVVGALRVHLTGPATAAVVSRRTASPEAHELYLQGRYFYEKRTEDGLR
ncbi:MAG TPA: serine/threonine-protein kinase, partial [Gemmatimonadales bacterium]|nr:serine/threonine-protein kinase [Gemmatimonadales bacterium]